MILIYLAVIVLFFVLWSHEDSLVPGWLPAVYGIEKAVQSVMGMIRNDH